MDDLIKKMDDALARADENAGYEAFVILRKNWPAMRAVLGLPQSPDLPWIKDLLREARHYVSDAFLNDDMEANKHSQSLLKEIDAALASPDTRPLRASQEGK